MFCDFCETNDAATIPQSMRKISFWWMTVTTTRPLKTRHQEGLTAFRMKLVTNYLLRNCNTSFRVNLQRDL